MAHSSRTWTGARSPQGKKRVRQAERRNEILQPRRSAAKTLVKSALVAAGTGEAEQTQAAVILAVSALDRAAKVGAIHPNAAARRKSRLMLKVNATLGGDRRRSPPARSLARPARRRPPRPPRHASQRARRPRPRASRRQRARHAQHCPRPAARPPRPPRPRPPRLRPPRQRRPRPRRRPRPARRQGLRPRKATTAKAAPQGQGQLTTQGAPAAKATTTKAAPKAKAAPKSES